jgi:two-component system cell cycle response regulator
MPTFMTGELLKSCKVLVVDDEPDSVEVAKILLSFHGANVITASNGQEGLAAATIEKPLFIVSDLSMPAMSGFAMLQTLKKDPRTRDIPIIALTAHAMATDREHVRAAGFHSYVSKPIDPDTFVRDLVESLYTIPEIAQRLNNRKECLNV